MARQQLEREMIAQKAWSSLPLFRLTAIARIEARTMVRRRPFADSGKALDSFFLQVAITLASTSDCAAPHS